MSQVSSRTSEHVSAGLVPADTNSKTLITPKEEAESPSKLIGAGSAPARSTPQQAASEIAFHPDQHEETKPSFSVMSPDTKMLAVPSPASPHPASYETANVTKMDQVAVPELLDLSNPSPPASIHDGAHTTHVDRPPGLQTSTGPPFDPLSIPSDEKGADTDETTNKAHNKQTRNTDDDEALAAAQLYISSSAMPNLTDDSTDWMDTHIFNRPVADTPSRGDTRGGHSSGLSPEDVMEYLRSVENPPGHPRRSRRLVQAKKLRRDTTSELPSEPRPNPSTPDKSPDPHQQAGGPNDEENETVDNVAEEKEHVIEAAHRLGCKRRCRVTNRREQLPDDDEPAALDDQSTKTPPSVEGDTEGAANLSRQADNERIILAEGLDGKPHRYKLTREKTAFWTIRGMTTALLDHQILGVDWMVNDKELGDKGPRGGLLADAMGLGKTMQVIATIVSNPPPAEASGAARVTLIIAPTALLRQWKEEIESHTAEGVIRVHIHHGGQKLQTLRQLSEYDVVITSYSTIAFSHPSPKRPGRGMSQAEVEEWWEEQWSKRGMFHRTKFWRVCIDESHYIKNTRARTSAACTSLRAVNKWSISGTPIQNSLLDMYAQFRFLGHPNYSNLRTFQATFGHDGSRGVSRACRALQVELSRCMVRRNKGDMLCGRKLLDLTPKSIEMVEVDFSPEERQLYKVLEAKTIERVNQLRRSTRGESSFHFHALALLMRLRQLCNHPYMILAAIQEKFTLEDLKMAMEDNEEQEKLMQDDDDTELPADVTNAFGGPRLRSSVTTKTNGLRRILELAQEEAVGDAGQCAVCLDVPEDPVLTNCRHCYCQGCITDVIQRAAVTGEQSRCPLCNTEVAIDDLKTYQPKVNKRSRSDQNPSWSSEENVNDKHWLELTKDLMPSAKLMALRNQLREWRENRPDDKIIIFSQFTKMLDLVAPMCAEEGWDTCRYQGGGDLRAREAALKRFKHEPDCCIMLTSLRAGGVGLNLTQANLVLSIDMWWNAAVENQAFDRVHRLGQRKEVLVTRFTVKGTVEQRILALQEHKLTLANAAMGEGVARVTKLSMRELMGLFGTVVRGRDGVDLVVQQD
ncbi:MAG: hypothetical protein M1817_001858 [Caeruleum heppii]|nr:MAG: hypothetical protein M1817_001858 [Caeruleum heppii]